MFVIQYCSKWLIFDPIYTTDSYNNIQDVLGIQSKVGVSISVLVCVQDLNLVLSICLICT